MSRHPAPAPDDVLAAILRNGVNPENRGLPLDVFIQLGLGRDPTAEEIRRMLALAKDGRRRAHERLAAAEAALTLAEGQAATGHEPGDAG